ncbi:hypothetical protein [Pelosinus sp. sgz500959]|uniref:hypothetical protein n=1 Tax=Pelosinus sp. sgz500959 TaxID=3242472 RepID=UPI003672CDAE
MNVTEQDYDSIRELGKKLHIPTPEMFWNFKIEDDKSDNVIHEHDERGHSWVRNAYNHLVCQMCAIGTYGTYGAGNINIKTVSGSTISSNPYAIAIMPASVESSGSGYCATAGDDNMGIVVGTSTTAFNFDQTALVSKIANGSSSGQLSHQAFSPIVKNYDSTSKTYTVTHSRVFNNNGSSTITINEVGIYATLGWGGSTAQTMTTRDVLATPIVVPPVSKVTITYTLSVAFPA